MFKPDVLTLADFLSGRGIWGRLRGLGPCPVPDTYSSEYLDTVLIMEYGERNVWDKVKDKDMSFIAEHIKNALFDKWSRLMELKNVGLDLSSSGGKVKTIKESQKNSSVKDTNNINQVSAYNSDDLVVDGGNTGLSNDSGSSDLDRIEKEGVLSYQNAFNNLTYAEQMDIIANVNKDIADLLTLNVYC